MRIRHEQLKRLRVQAGWTQEEVAARCKIDVRTYRKYERGEVNKNLSAQEAINRSDQYDVLDRIAACLGLTGPDELIEQQAPAPDAEIAPGPGSPYHPAWYVPREAEEKKARARLRAPGAPVVLQGPWLHGKATLLSYLLQQLRGQGQGDAPGDPVRVVHVNLFDLDDTSFTNLDSLLRTLGGRVLQALAVPQSDEALAETWKIPVSEKQKLSTLLKRHALQGQGPARSRLVLALERADRLQNCPFMHDLFALLRGWSEAGMEEPWSRLRILVTVATEPTLLEDTDHSSFFAMANPIRLEDMDRAQIEKLAALHHVKAPAAVMDRLIELCGGHPYLCRSALYEAMVSEVSLGEVLSGIDWTGGVFAQHLSHLRNWLRQTGLLPAVGSVLDEEGRTLPFLDYCKLYSKGLVVEKARGAYRMRCKLYEDYFRALWQGQRSSPGPGPGR
jgi:transcriptional regulator with XRE-family HTH domain